MPTAPAQQSNHCKEPASVEDTNALPAECNAVENGPSRTIMLAGAGCYTVAKLMEADGIYLPQDQRDPESIAERFDEICDLSAAREILDGNEHVTRIVEKAIAQQS